MKKYAVIGNPVKHSLSPQLHKLIYKSISYEADYEKILVESNQLNNFYKNNSLDGFNITIPHKIDIIPLLKDIDDVARSIQSVNCIFETIGFNTDWLGIKKSLNKNNISLKDKNCLILGSGGVCRTIIYTLYKEGAKTISIKNRKKNLKISLMKWVNKLIPNNHAPKQNDVIINCTSVGMWPSIDEIPFGLNNFSKDQIIIDTIYNPLETALIKKAKKSGAKTINGLEMFIFQAIESINIWIGEDITHKLNLNHIKKELELILCLQN